MPSSSLKACKQSRRSLGTRSVLLTFTLALARPLHDRLLLLRIDFFALLWSLTGTPLSSSTIPPSKSSAPATAGPQELIDLFSYTLFQPHDLCMFFYFANTPLVNWKSIFHSDAHQAQSRKQWIRAKKVLHRFRLHHHHFWKSYQKYISFAALQWRDGSLLGKMPEEHLQCSHSTHSTVSALIVQCTGLWMIN